LSDLLEAVDKGDVAALVLLDLSAAFDTVDHDILCRRLELIFGRSKRTSFILVPVIKAKMHEIDFGWGSAPDPAGGAYSAPRPPSWI